MVVEVFELLWIKTVSKDIRERERQDGHTVGRAYIENSSHDP